MAAARKHGCSTASWECATTAAADADHQTHACVCPHHYLVFCIRIGVARSSTTCKPRLQVTLTVQLLGGVCAVLIMKCRDLHM